MADLIAELMKGTKFESMSSSKILTSRGRIPTPLEALNCLLGGGFPMGGVYHMFGSPRSGKSTLFYQTMGLYQKKYPDGISIIIDMESSADPNRLEALGVDVSRTIRLPATSIENGFKALMKLIKNKEETESLKKVPIFVIWDTISKGLATDSTIQSRMAAMDRARVIKGYMSELQKSIEKHDFFLGLLNQVVIATDSYGNKKEIAGGGIALQHDVQLSLHSKIGSDKFNDYGMLTNRYVKLNIDKSKIGPEIKNLNCNIDATRGGLINERSSFISYCEYLGLLDPGSKGWHKMKFVYNHKFADPVIKMIIDKTPGIDKDKSMRRDDYFGRFREDELFFYAMTHMYMLMVESIYTLQKEVIKDYHADRLEQIKNICIERNLCTAEEFDELLKESKPIEMSSEDLMKEIDASEVENSNSEEETTEE